MSEFEEIPETKTIGGKRYKLYKLEFSKREAQSVADSFKKNMMHHLKKEPSVRVLPVTNGSTKGMGYM